MTAPYTNYRQPCGCAIKVFADPAGPIPEITYCRFHAATGDVLAVADYALLVARRIRATTEGQRIRPVDMETLTNRYLRIARELESRALAAIAKAEPKAEEDGGSR